MTGPFASNRKPENLLVDQAEAVTHRFTGRLSWETITRLAELRVAAVGLPNGLVISNQARRQTGTLLLPMKDAIRRLEQARTLAKTIDGRPMMIACTNALEARYLTADDDPQDRRYLTGVRTIDGSHIYCGGIDAAVRRAVAYAPYADVICYRTSRLDLAKAQCFASAFRTSFPDKPLGVGFSFQCGLDDFSHNEKLFQLGFSHCFLTLSESFVFPMFPEAGLWVLLDDGVESRGADSLTNDRHFYPPAPSTDLRSAGRQRNPHSSALLSRQSSLPEIL